MTPPHQDVQDRPDEGQVSEVSGLTEPTQQAPGDSVAGAPDKESGRPDEGPTGPDAVTFADEDDHYPDKGDVETIG